jgi:integrase
MATYKQRDNGAWQAVIRRKGFPVQSKTFEKKTDAEIWARKVESDLDRGIYIPANEAERTTLGDLIKEFVTDFAPHHYRQREDKKEAWRFQCDRLSEAMGSYSLAALDQRVIREYRDGRLAGAGDRPKVGDSTVRKELYMLSKILGYAETELGITLPRGNVIDKVRKPSSGKSRDRRLNAKEMEKLLAECEASRNPFLNAAVLLAMETAMRQGELLQLEWSDIDYKRNLAFLRDPDKIKNEEPRAVPLSPKAVEVLKKLHRPKKGGVILVVERMTLYHAFMYACQRAKIKDFTFHDLRHEALSRLAERGDFSVLEMAAVSGHKTLQMLKRYTHLQAEKLSAKLRVPLAVVSEPESKTAGKQVGA